MAIVETKVQQASLWTLGGSLVLALINALDNNSALIDSLPPLAQFAVIGLVLPALTFLGGYIAQHTPRPDQFNYGEPLEPHLPAAPAPAPAPQAYEPPYEPYDHPAEYYEPDRTAQFAQQPLYTHPPQMAPQRFVQQQPAPRPAPSMPRAGRHQAPSQPPLA